MAFFSHRVAECEGSRLPDHKNRRESINFRVWLLLGLGTVTGGGLAIEYVGHGEYAKGLLAGLFCAGCLLGLCWAFDDA